MKLFECPQLARCGTTITIGFAQDKFVFVCYEREDEAGVPSWPLFITPEGLRHISHMCAIARTDSKTYERNVTLLKQIFHKFGFWSLKDDNTRKNFEEIMNMLRNEEPLIYEFVKDCDLTVDVVVDF